MSRPARPKNAESERLASLVELLGSDPAFATGAKRFPESVSANDAAEIALAMCEQVDKGTVARAAGATEQGLHLACSRGCNACCEELVLVYLPEALAVARWLERPENHATRDWFVASYERWRVAVGDAPEQLAELRGRLDGSGYRDLHEQQWRRQVLCAFNRDGECAVYPVRPLVCRTAHALDTNELCRGGESRPIPAKRLAFKPLDDFLPRARGLLAATHAALGATPARPEALCEQVRWLLDD